MSPRGAIVLMDPEVLPEAASLILDHGLKIECSLHGQDYGFGGKVALVVTGDQLPEACADYPPRVVSLVVTVEAYGLQRLRRISEIKVDDLATENYRRAFTRSL